MYSILNLILKQTSGMVFMVGTGMSWWLLTIVGEPRPGEAHDQVALDVVRQHELAAHWTFYPWKQKKYTIKLLIKNHKEFSIIITVHFIHKYSETGIFIILFSKKKKVHLFKTL
jgi:hypothetical protein